VQSGTTGSVVRGVKGAQVLGRAMDQAMTRRMKLNDALGKFRAGSGKQ
jgi:hypothetical protein